MAKLTMFNHGPHDGGHKCGQKINEWCGRNEGSGWEPVAALSYPATLMQSIHHVLSAPLMPRAQKGPPKKTRSSANEYKYNTIYSMRRDS